MNVNNLKCKKNALFIILKTNFKNSNIKIVGIFPHFLPKLLNNKQKNKYRKIEDIQR